jgi:predicted RecB family nuclease
MSFGAQVKKITITEDVVESYSICKRKAYQILFQKSEPCQQQYAVYLREKIRDAESVFIESNGKSLPFSLDSLEGKAEVILNARFNINSFTVNNVHLEKRETKSNLGEYSYEPVIFSSANKVNQVDRIKASYIGDILHKTQGKQPEKSLVVLNDGKMKSIRIDKAAHIPITNKLKSWINSDLASEIPPFFFNKHCPICPFEKRCLIIAEKGDSISLLGNMTANVSKKFESKGIFTIRQLSYLYKPRRRSHHWSKQKVTHQYELQALALRTKHIYTNDLLEIQHENTELFLDIESMPDQQFHYLIGIYVYSPDIQKYYPLWANSMLEEINIWISFIEIVKRYSSAKIFHYGSYEKKVIKQLGDRYDTNIDELIDRLCNVNEFIYGRIYFPTRTNRLKDLGKYLGFTWTAEDPSGLNSIVWRHDYDKKNNFKIRNDLITYNHEDCTNLKKLKDIVRSICIHDPKISNIKAVNDKNQLLNTSSSQIVKDFETLIKSAHGRYEDLKLSIKKSSKKKDDVDKSRKSNVEIIPKSKIDKLVYVPRGRICPSHKCVLFHTELVAEIVIIDLVCSTKGIKRVITKYWGYKGRCPKCSHRHHPPGISKYPRGTKYGYGFKAWIAYQRLAMRLPYRKISQLLEDSFSVEVGSGGINSIFRNFSTNYIISENKIFTAMLKSQKIHVDETLVNIQGKIQYVWVFTDDKHVVFKLTATRESTIVHQLLKNYKGVLVSDFFAGYDAVECPQQKCWVHLIRDINDDLHKFPFDFEFELFVSSLRDILIPIFDTIEKYGLKKRNLNKFNKYIVKYYRKNIDEIQYESDIARKYQKRLSRYRNQLFVFLDHDGIPWNNNMAERALRHLAVQRKISGSFFASGMTDYLILLGVMQTCRFQNKPLLEFLMSVEKDIDRFKGKKNIKGWIMN